MIVGETAVQALLWKVCPLYQQVGLVVESARNGIYRVRVPLTPQNGNHLGTVHAAIQWAAGEVLGGIVIAANIEPELLAGVFVAVRAVSVEFARPACTAIVAEALVAESETRRIVQLLAHRAEAVFRICAEIRIESGETVATTDAEYVARPLRVGKQTPVSGWLAV